MNIYVVPEIDIERFKETGVFAVRLLNNEAMTHDGIYLESDGAKEFAEFFKDNIFPAEKFEELVEWGIKADAKSANLVRAIINSRVCEIRRASTTWKKDPERPRKILAGTGRRESERE